MMRNFRGGYELKIYRSCKQEHVIMFKQYKNIKQILQTNNDTMLGLKLSVIFSFFFPFYDRFAVCNTL